MKPKRKVPTAKKKPVKAAPVGPRHLQIYHRLRTKIESGKIVAGTLLPKEDALGAEYQVSRYALREALGQLERQGYIERRRRAGTRVLPRPAKGVLRHVAGSRDDVLGIASGTTIKFSSPRKVQSDTKLARLLGCDELREWHLLEGVRIDTTEQRPIGFTRVYVDANRATIPAKANFGGRPIFEWLEEKHQIRLRTLSQDISAVAMATSEAKALGEKTGTPALRIIRRYFDATLRNYIISITTHRSADFVYNLRMDIEQ